jgi:hypothetical protein
MIREEINMKKLLLLALAFFGIGGASVASANTVIIDQPAAYEAQLQGSERLVGHHHHHHGYHHRHHRYRGYYDDGYYYYYPRHRYYDYYYYY